MSEAPCLILFTLNEQYVNIPRCDVSETAKWAAIIYALKIILVVAV